MAWRRLGDKPLSEPMMVSLLTHISVNPPQWVKQWRCRLSCTNLSIWYHDSYHRYMIWYNWYILYYYQHHIIYDMMWYGMLIDDLVLPWARGLLQYKDAISPELDIFIMYLERCSLFWNEEIIVTHLSDPVSLGVLGAPFETQPFK